jgi:hypothetical protein
MPDVLEQMIAALPADALDYRPALEEWTIREILAHLVDDEMYVMRTRMERIIKEDTPHLAPHDEKHWFAQRNTSRDALGELLADFRLQRAASLGMVRMLRPADWARTGFHPEYGTFSAAAWLGYWLAHDATHLDQIAARIGEYQQAVARSPNA